VIANGLLVVGLGLLVGWVAGVAGAFGATTNWTLFVAGSAIALASRAFAR
jgi:hypothetical protein